MHPKSADKADTQLVYPRILCTVDVALCFLLQDRHRRVSTAIKNLIELSIPMHPFVTQSIGYLVDFHSELVGS